MHIDLLVYAVILKGTDQFQAGSVPDMGQARVAVTTKVPLTDQSILGAVKNRSPLFKLVHAGW